MTLPDAAAVTGRYLHELSPYLVALMHERNGKPLTICLVAGDVSGDQNGGRLARALADLEPEVRLIGVGGAAMRHSGVEVGSTAPGFSTIGPPDIVQARCARCSAYGAVRVP